MCLKTDNTEIIDCIDRNLNHWDKEHNINLRKTSEIYGESYELNYINSEGEFVHPFNTIGSMYGRWYY